MQLYDHMDKNTQKQLRSLVLKIMRLMRLVLLDFMQPMRFHYGPEQH